MKETQVFKRGQVWFVNDNFKGTAHVQSKSRPYLVISNDKCNANSPVIHMAPLTTQAKSNLPTHVEFYSPSNIYQTILVEQTMLKSVSDILACSKYMYTLTDEIMQKVDKAIAVQFSIQVESKTLDDFEAMLDKIKERKISEIREESNKLTKSRAEAYAKKISEELDSIKSNSDEKPKGTPRVTKSDTFANGKPRIVSQIDKFNARLAKSEAAKTSKESSANEDNSHPKRNIWTLETKREFLADATNPNISRSELLSKYHMTKSTYYSMISKFKRELSSENSNTSASSRKE